MIFKIKSNNLKIIYILFLVVIAKNFMWYFVDKKMAKYTWCYIKS